MRLNLRPLSDQVIVITGASSGIGLATARAAAREGAKVVLVARSPDALRKAADAIELRGGEAHVVEADVGRRADLDKVAEEAVTRFGRIDTWVNNAGVGILGRIEQNREADMRALFETNFWGVVNGSLAALPHLRRSGGALINIGSILSDRAIPLQGVYCASKHAVRGFTEALRVELAEEGAPVSVTLVKPGSIGTPMPQHMRTDVGRMPQFPPPVYAPEEVAKAILDAAVHPVRDVYVGGAAPLIAFVSALAPGLVDWVSARTLPKAQVSDHSPAPRDNLHAGYSQGRVRGDFLPEEPRTSLYNVMQRNPLAALGGLALGAAGLAAILLRPERDRSWQAQASRRLLGR